MGTMNAVALIGVMLGCLTGTHSAVTAGPAGAVLPAAL